jgi:predicted nucleic acid-binding protein
MPAGNPRVFDSWAIIALLEDEPGAAVVRSLITGSLKSQAGMWISIVNLGEVWYRLARLYSPEEADAGIEDVRRLGFMVKLVDWPLTREAARFKSRYAMSYADCFAAALAKQLDLELVTGDPEFKQLRGEIKIHWV